MASRADTIAEARLWIGTPYAHQASLKGVSCDCLGLVRGVWRAIYGNESLRPTHATWAEVRGIYASRSASLMRGLEVLFDG
jgi:NlpC/P60 family putative phage cell wall peptidase